MEEKKEPDYFRYYDVQKSRRRSGRGPVLFFVLLLVIVLAIIGYGCWYWMENGTLPFV